MPAEESAGEFPPNTVHVIRTQQQIHVMLSQMADQKANMLLAATFVVFTISIGQVRQIAEPLPLLILGAAAFLAGVVAILAVQPATHFRKDGPVNLLFFGSFTQFEEEDYIRRITDEVRTDLNAYRMMARDLYQNGVVLERRKYRLIGYAYRIFLVGLVASFLAFVAEYFWI